MQVINFGINLYKGCPGPKKFENLAIIIGALKFFAKFFNSNSKQSFEVAYGVLGL